MKFNVDRSNTKKKYFSFESAARFIRDILGLKIVLPKILYGFDYQGPQGGCAAVEANNLGDKNEYNYSTPL